MVTVAVNGWAEPESAWWLNLQINLHWWASKRKARRRGEGAEAPLGLGDRSSLLSSGWSAVPHLGSRMTICVSRLRPAAKLSMSEPQVPSDAIFHNRARSSGFASLALTLRVSLGMSTTASG